MAQITLNSSGVASSGSLLLQTNGTTTQATVDTSGNLGLGVTPSAWWSSMKALQVGSGAALYDFGSSNVALGSNIYFDGTNSRYINTDYASYYQQNNGAHIWATAASGTAGNSITFTQAMTLDASGNLGIGTTSPVSPLTAARGNVTGAGQWASSAIAVYNPTNIGSYSQIAFGYTSGTTNAAAYIGFVSTNQGSNGYGDLVFGTRSVNTDTQPTERARIDSSGNLLVGATDANDSSTGFKYNNTKDGAGHPRLVLSDSGTTNSYVPLGVYSTGASAYRFYVGAGGTIYATSTTISAISSDQRLKQDIVDYDKGLAEVLALRPRSFAYKKEPDRKLSGFISQEVQTVFPDAIEPTLEDPEMLTYSIDWHPLLVKAIQEMKTIIDQQAERIAALEAK